MRAVAFAVSQMNLEFFRISFVFSGMLAGGSPIKVEV